MQRCFLLSVAVAPPSANESEGREHGAMFQPRDALFAATVAPPHPFNLTRALKLTTNRLVCRRTIFLGGEICGLAQQAVSLGAPVSHVCTHTLVHLRKQSYLLGAERESKMLTEIGHIEAIFRYPVKSMGGERLEVAQLGWHGLDGDRRLAFRRMDDRSGFP